MKCEELEFIGKRLHIRLSLQCWSTESMHCCRCLAIPEKLSFQHWSLQSINYSVLMSVEVKIGKTKVHQTILQIFILNFFSAVWHNAQQSILFGIFGNQAPSNVQHNSQLLKDGSEWKMANLFKHCLSVSVKLLSGLLHATLSIWRPPILRPLRL